MGAAQAALPPDQPSKAACVRNPYADNGIQTELLQRKAHKWPSQSEEYLTPAHLVNLLRSQVVIRSF
jgi:hypothetical protein